MHEGRKGCGYFWIHVVRCGPLKVLKSRGFVWFSRQNLKVLKSRGFIWFSRHNLVGDVAYAMTRKFQ